MDKDMDVEPPSPEVDIGEPDEPCPLPEPRITNRAQGGVRNDKTRFIRPVERQRMRPWLIDHLDKNDIPGLVWQDRKELIFRISWKHAANQCFNMQKDTNLFERWAIHTGRHQDSDHKRWKANFRCALNSLPDVTEMKEQGVKKGNNAFKVYRFLNEKEVKVGKDGKPRKKRDYSNLIYREETEMKKLQDDFRPFTALEVQQGSSFEVEVVGDAASSSLPDLHQLVPTQSGVDLLLEADSKERLQPVAGGMDNLQEILAAATASLAAGSDAQALEKISIEQLSRLGEVSRMRLDIRQSDRKRRKKEVSGILNVFLCNWCEKVFPTKTDLFQHFLVVHQDKLLSGEDYGVRKPAEHSEKLQQEIEDLEKKVLGFTQETYQQKDSEEVIEDGQVVDMSSNNSMTSQDIYIEDQVLDLSVAGALARVPQPQLDVALDLSISTSNKQKSGQKNGTPKTLQKRRRSSTNDVNYNVKFGNYGLAGAPRTKRQLSLLLKRKEEEEEKQRKQAEAQHSMEDIVHAEILMSLKSGSKEENEAENTEIEKEGETVIKDGKDKEIKIEIDQEKSTQNDSNETTNVETETNEFEQMEDQEVGEERVLATSEKIFHFRLKDGSKVSVSEQVKHEQTESQTGTGEAQDSVESCEQADSSTVVKYDDKGSSGKPYKCALCVERFEDPTELLKHVSVHKTEYMCSVCMEVMTDKNVYLNHIESHLPHVKYKEKAATESASKKSVNQASEKDGGKGLETWKDNLVKTDERDTTINEKGAANSKGIEEQKAEDERKVLKVETTRQKNLLGEPAVNPAAGSGYMTGKLDTIKSDNGKSKVDSAKKAQVQRKYTQQESFELAFDCLQETNTFSNQKTCVKNDVVDGEQEEIVKNSIAGDIVTHSIITTGEGATKKMSEKKEDAGEDVTPVSVGSSKQLKESLKSCRSPTDSPYTDAEKTKIKMYETIKQTGNFFISRKCEICSDVFGTALDLKNHTLLHKETIEDKIRKNVFHCGLCDKELHINDVKDHLQSHKSGQKETKRVQLNYDCPCMICEQVVPVKKFYSHLKSHSVYELSQAQNLLLAQASAERKEGSIEGKKPFVCNLCSVKFETFSDLKNHVNTHLGPRIVKTEDTGHEIPEQKPTLSSNSPQVLKLPVKASKRKASDEKKITGKRPKQKINVEVKLKANIKSEKEGCTIDNNEEFFKGATKGKTETSSVIAAALKTGPKYDTSALAVVNSQVDSSDDQKTAVSEGVASEIKLETDLKSVISKLVKLDKFQVLKSGEVVMKGDKALEQLNENKRKVKDQHFGNKVQKRQKITVEEMSVHLDTEFHSSNGRNIGTAEGITGMNGKQDDDAFKISNARNIVTGKKSCNKEQNLPHVKRAEVVTFEDIPKVATEESYESTNDPLPDTQNLKQKILLLQQDTQKLMSSDVSEKKSVQAFDSSSLGSNVLPSTLRYLQQKILASGEPSEKKTGSSFDSSSLETNVPPSTLRYLQQKILLEKQGALTIATPFFHQSQQESLSLDSFNRSTAVPICATTDKDKSFAATTDGVADVEEIRRSSVPVSVVKNVNFNAPILTSTTSQQTNNCSSQSTSGVRLLEASQKLLLAAANASVMTPGIAANASVSTPGIVVQLSSSVANLSSPQVARNPHVLATKGSAPQSVSAVQVADSVNLSSACNVSQLLAAVSTLCKAQGTVTKSHNNTEHLQSSVRDISEPQCSLSSPLVQAGVPQKTPGIIPVNLLSANTPVTQADVKGSILADSIVIDKAANTASTISTLLKSQQQQQQLSMMKLNLSKINPQFVYKPPMALGLPTLGNLQHTVPGVCRYQNANMPVPELSTEPSKSSNFQLVWLPVNQVSNATAPTANLPGLNQTCIIVPASSASGIVLENKEQEPLSSTASRENDNVKKSIQPNIGYLSSICPTPQTLMSVPELISTPGNILSTSAPVTTANAKEKVSVSLSSHASPAVQSLEANKCVSDVSSVHPSLMMPTLLSSSTALGVSRATSTAINNDSNLLLACGICKQALDTLEQMSSHVCQLPAVNLTGQKFVTLTRLTKPNTSSSPASSVTSARVSDIATSSLSPTSQPMKFFVVPATTSAPGSRTAASSQPDLLTVNLDGASKTFKKTVAMETPTLSSTVVMPSLNHNTLQVSPKSIASKLSASKTEEINVIETPKFDSESVLQRSESPHYVYILPNRSTDYDTVSTKAAVKTVNATSVKVQTSCVSEAVSRPELSSRFRKTEDKNEDEVGLCNDPTGLVSTEAADENASTQSALKDQTKTATQQYLPKVEMPKPLSKTGQKVRAKILSNLCETSECFLKVSASNDNQMSENSTENSGCIQVAEDSGGKLASDVQMTEDRAIVSESKLTDQIITLYPCVICKQTFTFDQFMKHTKKHLTLPAKGVQTTTEDKQLMQDYTNVAANTTDTTDELTADRFNSNDQSLESIRQSDIYRCYLCFSSHDSETSLAKHYRTAHPDMATHLCPADDCAQLFIQIEEVDLHYASNHQHECKLCQERFRTYVEFQAHMTQHYMNRRLKYMVCNKCGVHFASRKAFSSHCRIFPFKRCSGIYAERFIECQQCHCCFVNFPSKECLKLHLKRKWYQRITYRCWICKETISSDEAYLNHMAKHMPGSDQDSDDSHISFCHTCCIVFPNRSTQTEHTALSSHIQASETRKNMLDQYSAKMTSFEKTGKLGFSSKSDEINLRDRALQSCGHFDEDGSTDANENDETNIMVVKGLSTCKQCDTCFATMFELKQHKVICHDRVRKRETTYTTFAKSPSKRFGMYSSRYFKQNRLVVCEFCGKRFFNIGLLRQHIDVSHLRKTYFACKNPECDKYFNSVYESETHVCESLSSKNEEAESNICVDIVQPTFNSMKEYVLQYYVDDCRQLLDKVASMVESIQEHIGDHFLCQYCIKRFGHCEKLKLHLLVQHAGFLAQCVDCQDYFFHETALLEHRRDCAIKGFSDEDFHTKKKVLGCHVCMNAFIRILGLTKYLRDVKFLAEKNKSNTSKCMTRKGVFALKSEEENSITFNNSRKFVCVSCKNEYCNAEDFFICMKARLVIERNKPNEEGDETTTEVKKEPASDEEDAKTLFKPGSSLVDLRNVFFCHDCEAVVCYEEGGMCAAILKHSCNGSETIL